MRYVQLSINQFFQSQNVHEVKPKVKKTETETSKELLEPLFVREIPDDPRYSAQLVIEYELIDKNNFAPCFPTSAHSS